MSSESHVATHGAEPAFRQHHFINAEQQFDTSKLGMWLFLVTEIMFFGGLFTAYMVYRMWYPVAWAEASQKLNVWMGLGNTIVLIGSSLTMALAVRSSQLGQNKATMRWLFLTMALGLVFLVVKGFEYREKFVLHEVPGPNFHFEGPESRHAQIFFSLYFAMTGVHALHMVIGFGLLSVIAWMAHKERFSKEWYTPVELAGLYWHFVDIVWIFLFPLLYLVDRTHKFV